jgi:hypothetical protein
MATYYKYAERSAEDYVDWGAIGKTMSDTLLKEQANRDRGTVKCTSGLA